MIRRKRYAKLPLQAHFYPMPASAAVQTADKKWSLLGRQALGVASLEPGWMEVMLDRRLDQDDDRGLAEVGKVVFFLRVGPQFRTCTTTN